ncbi:hypothetical protein ACVWWG_002583 [Bradyrhizobium sp. LB7.2]
MPSISSMPLARQSCTALAPVGDRAAAHRDDQVCARFPRRIGGGDHRLARGVRGHGIEDARAACAQGLFDLGDFVGLPVERARHHQEGATRPQPVHLRDHSVGGGVAEHNLLDRAVNDTSLVHACPPRTIRLVFWG